MQSKHKTFVSYHHSTENNNFIKNDSDYIKDFEKICSKQFDVVSSKSVQDADISIYSSPDNRHRIIRDDYLRNSTVTVVLIGNDTWKRKHVYWELSSILNPRSGLIGMILPSFKNKYVHNRLTVGRKKLENSYPDINVNYIPQRLGMNINNGFAKIYDWSDNPYDIQDWIHQAYERRNHIVPDNSLQMYTQNKSSYMSSWN